jgi:hypothetical protein
LLAHASNEEKGLYFCRGLAGTEVKVIEAMVESWFTECRRKTERSDGEILFGFLSN